MFVEVIVSWPCVCYCTPVDISKRIIVNANYFVAVFDEIRHGHYHVVRLVDGVRHLLKMDQFNFLFQFASAMNFNLSTLESLTLSDGKTENDDMMRKENSSCNLVTICDPRPEPVPPPIECIRWTPCRSDMMTAEVKLNVHRGYLCLLYFHTWK